jgi:hypothetical protein
MPMDHRPAATCAWAMGITEPPTHCSRDTGAACLVLSYYTRRKLGERRTLRAGGWAGPPPPPQYMLLRRALASPRVGARITRGRFSTTSNYLSHFLSHLTLTRQDSTKKIGKGPSLSAPKSPPACLLSPAPAYQGRSRTASRREARTRLLGAPLGVGLGPSGAMSSRSRLAASAALLVTPPVPPSPSSSPSPPPWSKNTWKAHADAAKIAAG